MKREIDHFSLSYDKFHADIQKQYLKREFKIEKNRKKEKSYSSKHRAIPIYLNFATIIFIIRYLRLFFIILISSL